MTDVIKMDAGAAEAAVLGGAVLGGGGGGWIEDGRALAREALEKGFSQILPLERLPDDATLLTVSAVGAPSAGRESLKPDDYVRAVTLFIEKMGIAPDGLISNEIGALAVVNGWLQSAVLGIPVVDAPANGRAHPTGLMGSLGLHKRVDYVSQQTAIGGDAAKGTRVEAFFSGPLEQVSKDVRAVAVAAGGMVAVARNPVPARYVAHHGAPGAIAMAIEIGAIWTKSARASAEQIISGVCEVLGASVIAQGTVEHVHIKTEGGFDCGSVIIVGAGLRPARYEMTFWNEYMTLEAGGKRLATFPDLIMTFSARTAAPLISAEIKEHQEVAVITVPARRLILGVGVRDTELLKQVEEVIGKEIVKYFILSARMHDLG